MEKLREAIDTATDVTEVCEIIRRFEKAVDSAASHAHFTIQNELFHILDISGDSDENMDESTKELSHNNPDEAAKYLKALDNILDKFANDI